MTYFVLVDNECHELVQVSEDPLIAAEGQFIKARHGDVPDLTIYEWHPQTLSFVKKTRILTKLAFMKRFATEELVTIYDLAKTNTSVEVWLDMFKVAEEINLDDPLISSSIIYFESIGILAPGRSAEILK